MIARILVRLFFGDASWTDAGYSLQCPSGFASHLTYDRNLQIFPFKQGWEMTCPISPVQKFMPSFWARVLLRLLCFTSWSSRLTRRGIDLIRRLKGTAVNQSSYNLKTSRSPWILRRHVIPNEGTFQVVDRLEFKQPVNREDLFFMEGSSGGIQPIPATRRLPNLPIVLTQLEIIKTYSPQPTWTLVDVSVRID